VFAPIETTCVQVAVEFGRTLLAAQVVVRPPVAPSAERPSATAIPTDFLIES